MCIESLCRPASSNVRSPQKQLISPVVCYSNLLLFYDDDYDCYYCYCYFDSDLAIFGSMGSAILHDSGLTVWHGSGRHPRFEASGLRSLENADARARARCLPAPKRKHVS